MQMALLACVVLEVGNNVLLNFLRLYVQPLSTPLAEQNFDISQGCDLQLLSLWNSSPGEHQAFSVGKVHDVD